jgi:exonuclease SbcD
MTFRFIHAADIHLDSPLRGLERYEGAPAGKIRAATREALKNLVALAISEEVNFVLIAGDLYDGDWKDYNTGLFFASEMSKLREAGISVYLVSGNHDAASQIGKQLRMPENVIRFSTRKPQTVFRDDIGVAIHGQGFSKPAVTEDLSLGYPTASPGFFNIGILHTSATGREGHEPYAPCAVDRLLSKGYDYWALGHVHKREVLCDNPPIVFSGNIQGRHIRERGPKGCTLVTVEDGRVAAVEERNLDVLRWMHKIVDVTGKESTDEVLDRVAYGIGNEAEQNDGLLLALRLEIVGPCKAHSDVVSHSERLINEIRMSATDISGGSVWIEKILIRTEIQTNLDDILKRNDPLGGLLRSIQRLRSDDEGLADLMKEFSEFKRRLPPELQYGDDAIDLDDSGTRREMIDEVKQILIGRLLSKGSPE